MSKLQKDILSIWKERINKESKHGDKKKACDAAGSTASTYLNAMKRETFDDLTDGEQSTLQALIEILDERKAKQQKLKEKYTA
jgi:hypothetical protein